ncbi:MAG: flagellar basal body rod protein FlgB [Rubrivivax sp.]
MLNRLTNTLNFQGEALLLRSERQRLIASNIANADTPGYTARDFNFAQALRQATGTYGAVSGAPTGGVAGRAAGARAGSGAGELGSPVAGDLLADAFGRARLGPELNYARPAQTNLDDNSVDLDRERAAHVDNTLKYEAALRFINGTVRTIGDAMKSHNQG